LFGTIFFGVIKKRDRKSAVKEKILKKYTRTNTMDGTRDYSTLKARKVEGRDRVLLVIVMVVKKYVGKAKNIHFSKNKINVEEELAESKQAAR
jgi:hypothetical protein